MVMAILSTNPTIRGKIEQALRAKGFEFKYGHYYCGEYRFQMRANSVAFGRKIKGNKGYGKRAWWFYSKINIDKFCELADRVVQITREAREKARAARPATQGVSVEVKENEDKDGVEIRFAEKPDQSVIDQVKAHGFRWSKFQKLWYARRSPETLEFAYGLVGKKLENLDGPDMATVLEDEPSGEQGPDPEDGDPAESTLEREGEGEQVPAAGPAQFKFGGFINNPEYAGQQA